MISYLLVTPWGVGMLPPSSSIRGGTEALCLYSLTNVVQLVQIQSQNLHHVCLVRAHVWSGISCCIVESLVLMCCWTVRIFALFFFFNQIVTFLKSDIVIHSSYCFQKHLACHRLKINIKMYGLNWTLSLQLNSLTSPLFLFGGLGVHCLQDGWRENKRVFYSTDIFQRGRLLPDYNNSNIASFEVKIYQHYYCICLLLYFITLFLISKHLLRDISHWLYIIWIIYVLFLFLMGDFLWTVSGP